MLDGRREGEMWFCRRMSGAGWMPPPGSGEHTHLNGGAGLTNSSDPERTSQMDLACGQTPTCGTWTASPGGNENLPITCVN
jgi:hypothetical protein